MRRTKHSRGPGFWRSFVERDFSALTLGDFARVQWVIGEITLTLEVWVKDEDVDPKKAGRVKRIELSR